MSNKIQHKLLELEVIPPSSLWQKLEEELKKPLADRKVPEYGSDKDFQLIQAINQHTAGHLMRIQLLQEDELARMEEEQRIARERQLEEAKRVDNQAQEAPKNQPVHREEEKIGRNAPCPCGSGKKYKKCCGSQVA